MDRRQSPVDDLQKIWHSHLVKDNIITAIPNCPNYRTNSYTNPRLSFFINSIQPITKHISNIRWRINIESKVNNSPN